MPRFPSLSLSFKYIYINMRFFNALEGNPNPDQAKVQDSFEEKPKGPECFFSFFKNIKFFFFFGIEILLLNIFNTRECFKE